MELGVRFAQKLLDGLAKSASDFLFDGLPIARGINHMVGCNLNEKHRPFGGMNLRFKNFINAVLLVSFQMLDLDEYEITKTGKAGKLTLVSLPSVLPEDMAARMIAANHPYGCGRQQPKAGRAS